MRAAICLILLLLPLAPLPLSAFAAGGGDVALLHVPALEGEGPDLVARGLELVAELPDGYLAFARPDELVDLERLAGSATVLDRGGGGEEFLIVRGDPAGLPDGTRTLRSGDGYRIVAAAPDRVAGALGGLPDLQRVFRRPLRFVSEPWTEPAPRGYADDAIQAMVDGVAQSDLEAGVAALVGFGTRHSIQLGGYGASLWIRDFFLGLGYEDVSLHDFNDWNDNVVCVKPGAIHPERCVVIGGHYDSVSFLDSRFAPGADDNASGTVCVLEAARAFADAQFEYTVIFIAFSGEEQGLVGSESWAAGAAESGREIVAMINMDMLCYAPPGDERKLDIVSNDESRPLLQYALAAIQNFVPGFSAQVNTASAGGSDHVSFWSNGFRALYFTEDLEHYSPYLHSPNDLIGVSANDFPFMLQNVRAVVATAALLARPFHVYVEHEAQASALGTGPYPQAALIRSVQPLDPASLQLVYRIESGASRTLPLEFMGEPDLYGASIPVVGPGFLVEYFITASDVVGNTIRHPSAAPIDLHAFYTGVTAVLIDDLEIEPGWSSGAPDDDAEFGLWVWSDPVGTAYQPEDDHSPAPGRFCFVTGNAEPGDPAGKNDVDGGKTTLLSPPFDLSRAAWAGLSYWRWFADEVAQDDRFQVDLSNDGGSTWINLEMIRGNAYPWVRVSFDDLGARIPLTEAMRLRFVAEDRGEGSLVEAAVDDLEVLAVNSPVVQIEQEPATYEALLQAHPNPFNPRTLLRYQLPRPGLAEIVVFDPSGREVGRLEPGRQDSGPHEEVWDAGVLPTGLYLARLYLDGEPLLSRKLTLLR